MHAASLGLDENFGVLDAGDAADLLDMLREEHGGSQTARRFPRAATLLDVYSRTVNAQQPLDETIAGQFPWVAEHRERLGGDLPRLRCAQAKARRRRPRRPVALLAAR